MSPTERELRSRLGGLDRARPRVDMEAIEAAFRLHFDRIDLVDRPELRFMDDGMHALAVISENLQPSIRAPRVNPAYENKINSLQGSSNGAAYDPKWRHTQEELHTNLWNNDDHLVWGLVHDRWTSQMDEDERPMAERPQLWMGGGPNAGAGNFWMQARWAGTGNMPARRGAPGDATTRFGRSYSVAGMVGKAIAWASLMDRQSRWTLKIKTEDLRRLVNAYSPFVDMYAAGLWMYWIMPKEVLIVTRPTMLFDDRRRLHNATGPAVAWEAGERFYFWHGVAVDEGIVMEPGKYITVRSIDAAVNAEIRRVMIERFGTDRYLIEGGAQIQHQDARGTLYRKTLPGDEDIVMVKVRNSSPEPDGTFKDYFIRVPPQVTTASEAVAWTFGFDREEEYDPRKET